MSNYLDSNGLRFLWTKIKNRISSDIANKQNKLTGNTNQIVGFDSSGNAVARSRYTAVSFTISLPTSGWSGNIQTISDSRFQVNGHAYQVNPDEGSAIEAAKAFVQPKNITSSGQMTFTCIQTPSSNLTYNIIRIEVE